MAELRSSNPALARISQTPSGYAPVPGSPEYLSQMYNTQARVTLDDVIVRTLTLLAVLGLAAGGGWALVDGQSSSLGPVVLIPALIAFGIGLAVNRMNKVKPALVIAYAVFEGVAVGAISNLYEQYYAGIVLEALIGTGAIFVLMLVLHSTGVLRATPKMARIVSGAIGGIIIMYLVDIFLSAIGGPDLPLVNSASPLGILLSLAIVVVASLTFTLDFGVIENGIARGLPADESWRMGFGLLVSFVWVYLELLRLLSKLQRR